MTSPADLEAARRYRKRLKDAADFIARVEQVRRTLTCPTCGGRGRLITETDCDYHGPEGCNNCELCPDCVDGHPSIERMAALWTAVHDAALAGHTEGYQSALAYLRTVRATP